MKSVVMRKRWVATTLSACGSRRAIEPWDTKRYQAVPWITRSDPSSRAGSNVELSSLETVVAPMVRLGGRVDAHFQQQLEMRLTPEMQNRIDDRIPKWQQGLGHWLGMCVAPILEFSHGHTVEFDADREEDGEIRSQNNGLYSLAGSTIGLGAVLGILSYFGG